jgi:hypothetical protein
VLIKTTKAQIPTISPGPQQLMQEMHGTLATSAPVTASPYDRNWRKRIPAKIMSSAARNDTTAQLV